MNSVADKYLTTRELAALLRIKERKVYDMAASGQVPCVRLVGKLLFPQSDITRWIDSARSGPAKGLDSVLPEASIPATMTGSHDPLLEWALRESASGIAAFFDGSSDGIERFAERQGIACGTHIYERDGWNVGTVQSQLAKEPVVLVEFARRQRGFIVPPGNPGRVTDMASIAKFTIARRQASAASQQLLELLLAEAGVILNKRSAQTVCVRTEDDLAMQVFDGKSDIAFGLESVAAGLRLGFVPVLEERFDLLVWRKAWFDAPFQKFMQFTASETFKRKVAEMPGYDINGLGKVHFNSNVD